MSPFAEIPDAALSFGAVHLAPAVTLPIVVVLGLMGAWYWRRMGRGSVPPIRRRLRRMGLLLGGAALVLMTAAISFLDPGIHRAAYLIAWLAVLVVVMAAVLVAALDAIATVRLHQRSVERQLVRDAMRLREVTKARGGDAEPGSDRLDG